MIVHMTGLYTRLVTYARFHALKLVVRIAIIYHSYLCPYIVYLVILHFSYHVFIAYVVFACVVMHKHFFLYTHTH